MVMRVKSTNNRNILYDSICLTLTLYFFYESIQKIAYAEIYGFWVSHAPLIKHVGSVLKYVVPAAELIMAMMLMMSRFQRTGLYIIFAAELIFVFWIMSVYLFTGYLFWPYHALWKNPTWMQKMIIALGIAWFSLLAILLSPDSALPGEPHQQKSLRNTPADIS